jgi:GNAT superfamily N-acetyltransferase
MNSAEPIRRGWQDRPMDSTSALLDNAVWHALVGPHESFAIGSGAVRRYRPDVSVFWAVDVLDAPTWTELAAHAAGESVMLFRVGAPNPPHGWEILAGGTGHQMVLSNDPVDVSIHDIIRALDDDDVPAMLALVERSRPGPFVERTIELGGYVGIFDDDRLVAMAGRRMHLPGHVEVSAVTTDPDVRGRGYASALTARVARELRAEGLTPFLHVANGNLGAKRVYERLGFVERALVSFTSLRPPS